MADRTVNLGIITAFGEARNAGYTGTKAEFGEGLKKSADYANNAEISANSASQYAQNASQSAQDANSYSSTAQQSAQNASQSAQNASSYADRAETAAQTAIDHAYTISVEDSTLVIGGN